MNTIGEYIKTERKKAGLTQEEFALKMFGMEAIPGAIDRSGLDA
ncbi:hypothetical protein [Butyrivibrio sp. JL13D10]